MFMSAMVRIMFMSWKMECSIQRGELNGVFQLSTNEHNYSHHCTNEKHSLFVLYNIQVDLCHFDWKIQLSKQTKCRPPICNCRRRMLVILLICLAALRKTTRTQWCFYSTFSFHPKSTIARWQRAMVLFGWNEKARWVTQRAMVLLFAITWRTILQSNGKDLLGCYIKTYITRPKSHLASCVFLLHAKFTWR